MGKQVTQLLADVQDKRAGAQDELFEAVYNELRVMAASKLRNKPNGLLQPTALVHEMYMHMINRDGELPFENRRHFFGAASRAMWRIIGDYSPRAGQPKAGTLHETKFEEAGTSGLSDEEATALAEAIGKLDSFFPRGAEVVRLRIFAGLTQEQVAVQLDVTDRTVRRDWEAAIAWLRSGLADEEAA